MELTLFASSPSALHESIEADATEAIGADWQERGLGRVTHRNGHRPRTLWTKAGDLELGIPKLGVDIGDSEDETVWTGSCARFATAASAVSAS